MCLVILSLKILKNQQNFCILSDIHDIVINCYIQYIEHEITLKNAKSILNNTVSQGQIFLVIFKRVKYIHSSTMFMIRIFTVLFYLDIVCQDYF